MTGGPQQGAALLEGESRDVDLTEPGHEPLYTHRPGWAKTCIQTGSRGLPAGLQPAQGVARPGEAVPVRVSVLDREGNRGVAFRGEITLAGAAPGLELPVQAVQVQALRVQELQVQGLPVQGLWKLVQCWPPSRKRQRWLMEPGQMQMQMEQVQMQMGQVQMPMGQVH